MTKTLLFLNGQPVILTNEDNGETLVQDNAAEERGNQDAKTLFARENHVETRAGDSKMAGEVGDTAQANLMQVKVNGKDVPGFMGGLHKILGQAETGTIGKCEPGTDLGDASMRGNLMQVKLLQRDTPGLHKILGQGVPKTEFGLHILPPVKTKEESRETVKTEGSFLSLHDTHFPSRSGKACRYGDGKNMCGFVDQVEESCEGDMFGISTGGGLFRSGMTEQDAQGEDLLQGLHNIVQLPIVGNSKQNDVIQMRSEDSQVIQVATAPGDQNQMIQLATGDQNQLIQVGATKQSQMIQVATAGEQNQMIQVAAEPSQVIHMPGDQAIQMGGEHSHSVQLPSEASRVIQMSGEEAPDQGNNVQTFVYVVQGEDGSTQTIELSPEDACKLNKINLAQMLNGSSETQEHLCQLPANIEIPVTKAVREETKQESEETERKNSIDDANGDGDVSLGPFLLIPEYNADGTISMLQIRGSDTDTIPESSSAEPLASNSVLANQSQPEPVKEEPKKSQLPFARSGQSVQKIRLPLNQPSKKLIPLKPNHANWKSNQAKSAAPKVPGSMYLRDIAKRTKFCNLTSLLNNKVADQELEDVKESPLNTKISPQVTTSSVINVKNTTSLLSGRSGALSSDTILQRALKAGGAHFTENTTISSEVQHPTQILHESRGVTEEPKYNPRQTPLHVKSKESATAVHSEGSIDRALTIRVNTGSIHGASDSPPVLPSAPVPSIKCEESSEGGSGGDSSGGGDEGSVTSIVYCSPGGDDDAPFTVHLPGGDTSKPLGSSDNPIQLVQQGNTFQALQPVQERQLEQITSLLQQRRITAPPTTHHDEIYDPKTNMKIVYKVVYPEDILMPEDEEEEEEGEGGGASWCEEGGSGAAGGGGGGGGAEEKKRGRKRKDAKKTKGGEEEEDVDVENLDEVESSQKSTVSVTRSGRISRLPRHMVRDFRHLPHPHHSADSTSTLPGSGNQLPNSTPTPKPPEPVMELPHRKKRVVPRMTRLRYTCLTCGKLYVGRIEEHYSKFPDHRRSHPLSSSQLNAKSQSSAVSNTSSSITTSTSSVALSTSSVTPTTSSVTSVSSFTQIPAGSPSTTVPPSTVPSVFTPVASNSVGEYDSALTLPSLSQGSVVSQASSGTTISSQSLTVPQASLSTSLTSAASHFISTAHSSVASFVDSIVTSFTNSSADPHSTSSTLSLTSTSTQPISVTYSPTVSSCLSTESPTVLSNNLVSFHSPTASQIPSTIQPGTVSLTQSSSHSTANQSPFVSSATSSSQISSNLPHTISHSTSASLSSTVSHSSSSSQSSTSSHALPISFSLSPSHLVTVHHPSSLSQAVISTVTHPISSTHFSPSLTGSVADRHSSSHQPIISTYPIVKRQSYSTIKSLSTQPHKQESLEGAQTRSGWERTFLDISKGVALSDKGGNSATPSEQEDRSIINSWTSTYISPVGGNKSSITPVDSTSTRRSTSSQKVTTEKNGAVMKSEEGSEVNKSVLSPTPGTQASETNGEPSLPMETLTTLDDNNMDTSDHHPFFPPLDIKPARGRVRRGGRRPRRSKWRGARGGRGGRGGAAPPFQPAPLTPAQHVDMLERILSDYEPGEIQCAVGKRLVQNLSPWQLLCFQTDKRARRRSHDGTVGEGGGESGMFGEGTGGGELNELTSEVGGDGMGTDVNGCRVPPNANTAALDLWRSRLTQLESLLTECKEEFVRALEPIHKDDKPQPEREKGKGVQEIGDTGGTSKNVCVRPEQNPPAVSCDQGSQRRGSLGEVGINSEAACDESASNLTLCGSIGQNIAMSRDMSLNFVEANTQAKNISQQANSNKNLSLPVENNTTIKHTEENIQSSDLAIERSQDTHTFLVNPVQMVESNCVQTAGGENVNVQPEDCRSMEPQLEGWELTEKEKLSGDDGSIEVNSLVGRVLGLGGGRYRCKQQYCGPPATLTPSPGSIPNHPLHPSTPPVTTQATGMSTEETCNSPVSSTTLVLCNSPRPSTPPVPSHPPRVSTEPPGLIPLTLCSNQPTVPSQPLGLSLSLAANQISCPAAPPVPNHPLGSSEPLVSNPATFESTSPVPSHPLNCNISLPSILATGPDNSSVLIHPPNPTHPLGCNIPVSTTAAAAGLGIQSVPDHPLILGTPPVTSTGDTTHILPNTVPTVANPSMLAPPMITTQPGLHTPPGPCLPSAPCVPPGLHHAPPPLESHPHTHPPTLSELLRKSETPMTPQVKRPFESDDCSPHEMSTKRCHTDKLEQMNKLDNMSDLDRMNKLDPMNEFEHIHTVDLDKFGHMSKVEQMKKLDQMSKMDHMDIVAHIGTLEPMNKLDHINNLDHQVNKLENMNSIGHNEDTNISELSVPTFPTRSEESDSVDSVSKALEAATRNLGLESFGIHTPISSTLSQTHNSDTIYTPISSGVSTHNNNLIHTQISSNLNFSHNPNLVHTQISSMPHNHNADSIHTSIPMNHNANSIHAHISTTFPLTPNANSIHYQVSNNLPSSQTANSVPSGRLFLNVNGTQHLSSSSSVSDSGRMQTISTPHQTPCQVLDSVPSTRSVSNSSGLQVLSGLISNASKIQSLANSASNAGLQCLSNTILKTGGMQNHVTNGIQTLPTSLPNTAGMQTISSVMSDTVGIQNRSSSISGSVGIQSLGSSTSNITGLQSLSGPDTNAHGNPNLPGSITNIDGVQSMSRSVPNADGLQSLSGPHFNLAMDTGSTPHTTTLTTATHASPPCLTPPSLPDTALTIPMEIPQFPSHSNDSTSSSTCCGSVLPITDSGVPSNSEMPFSARLPTASGFLSSSGVHIPTSANSGVPTCNAGLSSCTSVNASLIPSQNSSIPSCNAIIASVNSIITSMNSNMAATTRSSGVSSCNSSMPSINSILSGHSHMSTINSNMASINSGSSERTCKSGLALISSGTSSGSSEMPAMNSMIPSCNSGLSSVNSGISSGRLEMPSMNANIDLTSCNNGVSTLNSGMSSITSGMSSGNAEISTVNTSLTSCNSTMSSCIPLSNMGSSLIPTSTMSQVNTIHSLGDLDITAEDLPRLLSEGTGLVVGTGGDSGESCDAPKLLDTSADTSDLSEMLFKLQEATAGIAQTHQEANLGPSVFHQGQMLAPQGLSQGSSQLLVPQALDSHSQAALDSQGFNSVRDSLRDTLNPSPTLHTTCPSSTPSMPLLTFSGALDSSSDFTCSSSGIGRPLTSSMETPGKLSQGMLGSTRDQGHGRGTGEEEGGLGGGNRNQLDLNFSVSSLGSSEFEELLKR